MYIELPYDNVETIKKGHDSMRSWHENMAKAHETAAAWHANQSDDLSKAMNEVPLDPEKRVVRMPENGGQQPATSGAGKTSPTQEVPLDPQSVKKVDLVDILKDHVNEFGSFNMSVEDIADIILGLK